MKVVIDARYVRDRPSGIGNYTTALVERLPGLATDVEFTFWTHRESPRSLGDAPNVKCHVVKAEANGPATLAALNRLGPIPSGAVFHAPYNIMGRGLRGPSVATIHDLMWFDCPEWCEGRPLMRKIRRPFYTTGIRWALQNANHVLTVSQASAARLLAAAPGMRDRITVTHNAASDAFCPPTDLAQAQSAAAKIIGSDAPYFLMVGQDQPYKAQDLAIRALAETGLTDTKIVIVQRLSGTGRLQTIADDCGVGKQLVQRSQISQPKLVTLLQASLGLLQPSLVEGFGMPALEAMASGCPVIASDIAPLIEVLGGAGVHVPAGSIAPLTEAMRRLHDDETHRQQLRAAGPERAMEFSWDRTARRTLDIYRHASEEGPIPPRVVHL